MRRQGLFYFRVVSTHGLFVDPFVLLDEAAVVDVEMDRRAPEGRQPQVPCPQKHDLQAADKVGGGRSSMIMFT